MENKKRLTPKIKKEIAEIKSILDNEKMTMQLIKDTKDKATELLNKGYHIDGYEMRQSWGNRAWIKTIDIDRLFSSFKKIITKKSDLYTTALKSPAVIEKYFIELPEEKEKLNKFIKRADRGEVLTRL